MSTVTPVTDTVYAALSAFIMAQLNLDQLHVVQGYGNRVAMPTGPFVLLTYTAKKRLGTNLQDWSNDPDNPPTNISFTQPQMVTVQIDCYGPQSSEWSDILSTLLRSYVGCDALAPSCQPFYADDPKRMPLTDAEDEYEDRWIVTLQLQVNSVVSTPQQFADTLELALIEVDARYPP